MTQNSLFSTQEFIEASRKFVCIRIETYENKASEAMVRKLLGGRFENTAFVLFDPSGTRMLSKTGRSPNQGLSSARGPGHKASDSAVVSEMNRIARKFKTKADPTLAELQDFHSFKQALNVAAADQRLLVLVNAPTTDHEKLGEKLKPVFADPETVGRFHLDFLDASTDKDWAKVLRGSKKGPGIMIVQSGQFGLDGKVVAHLGLDHSVDEIRQSLLIANQKFAKLEKEKTTRPMFKLDVEKESNTSRPYPTVKIVTEMERSINVALAAAHVPETGAGAEVKSINTLARLPFW